MHKLQELSERAREKSIRVFDYLAELARMRTKLTRDVNQYEHVFWYDSIPNDTACYTPAAMVREEVSDDTWLEIRKRAEPKCPTPPPVCREWIDERSLCQSANEPELRSRVPVNHPPASQTPNMVEVFSLPPEFKNLADFPEVGASWTAYVEKHWKPWAEEHRKWKTLQDTYSALFSIHQAMQRLGEEYELVLGLGFLILQRYVVSSFRLSRDCLAARFRAWWY